MFFSHWFWTRISWVVAATVLSLLILRCGKDSTLNMTKLDSKRVYFEIEASEATASNFGASARSFPSGLEMRVPKITHMDVPPGQPLTLQIALQPGWEVVDWTVFPPGPVERLDGDTRLILPAVDDDRHVRVEIRKIPIVRLTVKVIGKPKTTAGGGMVAWSVYQAGQPISNFTRIDYGDCSTPEIPAANSTRECTGALSGKFPDGYPNGSWIEFQIDGRRTSDGYYSDKIEAVPMTNHLTFTHDFSTDEKK